VEAHRERVGVENPVTLCDVGTLADQAAEPVPPENPDVCAWSRWVLTPGGRALLQRPVGPVNVVMIDIFAQDQPQVPFTGDQHPVQALAAGAMMQSVTACRAAVRRPFSSRGAFSRDRVVPGREPVLRMFLVGCQCRHPRPVWGQIKDQSPFAGCHAWPVYWRSVRRGGEAPGCRFGCRRRATPSGLRRRGG
jgi:hypothetical protein